MLYIVNRSLVANLLFMADSSGWGGGGGEGELNNDILWEWGMGSWLRWREMFYSEA